jgi:ABC-2 type transport system permease protein/lipopolysaccharide transport system permease protein
MTMTTPASTHVAANTPDLVLRGHDPQRLTLALSDIGRGLLMWRLWVQLGWNDILQRYRRSLLGPFWLTASTAIMVGALGFVYSKLFNIAIDEFIPFLFAGLMIWNLISSIITEAGSLFTGSESYIKQVRLPYSVYVYRFIWSKIIIFAHNVVIYFAVLLYFQISPGWIGLLAIPGLALLLLNGALTTLYIGMISARFRDIPQIISSFIQIVFFVTPIMWKPEVLRNHVYIAAVNPFQHLIEVARGPMLGTVPSELNYAVVFVITALNLLLAIAFFARFRSRISYWI